MKQGNFNDLKLRMWAIPMLALPACLLFDEVSIFDPDFFIDYLSFVFGFWLIWEVNRYIIFRAYKIMPKREELSKRLWWQLGTGIPLSIIIGMAVFLFNIFALKEKTWEECAFSIVSEGRELILPIFMITLCVNALYESVFLNQLWQASVIESEQHKKASLEAKFKHLKEQVNPHFLFNSLNALATLIEENPKRAVAYVEKLSEVYRYLLSHHDHEVVSLAKELEFAKAYLFLLKMRFEDNLRLKINIPATHLYSHHIPPLTLQMLIENAIKHNEIQRDKPLKITIELKEDRLVVQNSLQKKAQTKSTGLGLENIRQRYQFLTQTNVLIQESVEAFTVSLPLLKIQTA